MKPASAILWLFSWLPAVAAEPRAFEAFRPSTLVFELNVDLRPAADWSSADVLPENFIMRGSDSVGDSAPSYLLPALESADAVLWWREFRPTPSQPRGHLPEPLPRTGASQLPATVIAFAALLVAVAGSLLRRRFFGRLTGRIPRAAAGPAGSGRYKVRRKSAVI